MDVLTLVLAIGLVGRITILITRDVITQWLRTWVDRIWPGKIVTVQSSDGPMPVYRDGTSEPLRDPSMASQFIECPWCVSMWVSGAAAPLAYYAGDTLWFILPATIATLSFAASLLADR